MIHDNLWPDEKPHSLKYSNDTYSHTLAHKHTQATAECSLHCDPSNRGHFNYTPPTPPPPMRISYVYFMEFRYFIQQIHGFSFSLSLFVSPIAPLHLCLPLFHHLFYCHHHHSSVGWSAHPFVLVFIVSINKITADIHFGFSSIGMYGYWAFNTSILMTWWILSCSRFFSSVLFCRLTDEMIYSEKCPFFCSLVAGFYWFFLSLFLSMLFWFAVHWHFCRWQFRTTQKKKRAKTCNVL